MVLFVVEKSVARVTMSLARATASAVTTSNLASTDLPALPWHADTVKETGRSAVAMVNVK